MRILVDSNVLCRLARGDDPQHEEARNREHFQRFESEIAIRTPQEIIQLRRFIEFFTAHIRNPNTRSAFCSKRKKSPPCPAAPLV